jgi:hypothetical protein
MTIGIALIARPTHPDNPRPSINTPVARNAPNIQREVDTNIER